MPPSLTSVTVTVTTWSFFRRRRRTGLLDRIVAELLDAEADAFLLDVDVEHLGLDRSGPSHSP